MGVGVGPGGGVGTAGEGDGDGDTTGEGEGCGIMPGVLDELHAPSASVVAMNAAPDSSTQSCFSFIYSLTDVRVSTHLVVLTTT